MNKVDEKEHIRRAHYVEYKSIRQIARELGHSRETVRKALASAEPERYTLKQPRRAPVLGPYKARIDELLAENERLPPKQRYTWRKIYKAIHADAKLTDERDLFTPGFRWGRRSGRVPGLQRSSRAVNSRLRRRLSRYGKNVVHFSGFPWPIPQPLWFLVTVAL